MKLTTADFTHHLRMIEEGVDVGDSLEGSITYTASGDDEWEVEGCYRTGNLQGQGGMILFPPTPKCPECHGTGRTDNHVTGEVECSSCEGAGVVADPSAPCVSDEAKA